MQPTSLLIISQTTTSMKTQNISGTSFILLISLFFGLFVLPFPALAQKPVDLSESASTRFNHVISGTATFMPEGVPFEGLKISFSGVGETTVGPDGTYEMEVPRYWSGLATPYVCQAGGYSFNPPQIEYIDVRFDFPDQDYTGQANDIYTVSGRFTDKATGEPLANTEIKFNLTGINQVDEMYITTNEFGEYSFEKLPCWGDTLDPYLSGYYYFEPKKRGYAGLVSNLINQDYEVIDYEYPLPPAWETYNTGSFSFISIESTSGPDLCGEQLNVGDLLGVFYTGDNGELKCGGYTRWQDETNGFISAYGDDNTTPEKDGFAGFEDYTWRIYSYQQQISYPASVELVSGENYFQIFGLTKVGEIDGLFKNQIFINQGWSGISSYTMPDIFPALITNITNPISDELIIIQDMEKMYYPSAGINTLLLWKYNKGYKIKVNADAVLPMNGCPEDDRTFDLKTTWNIMPVLSECLVPATGFFDPVVDKLILVKEIGGTKIYWPEMNLQTLYMLQPGKAYFVAVSQNTTVDFSNSTTNAKSVAVEGEIINNTPWNNPALTGSSHVFAIKPEALGHFGSGDFIGAFTEDDICAGLLQVGEAGSQAVIAFGDDPSTSYPDGFRQDEAITFKLFDGETGDITEIIPDYLQGSMGAHGLFTDNGISVIDQFKVTTSAIGNTVQQIFISPNPAHDVVNLNMRATGKVRLTISDLKGQEVFNQDVQGNVSLDVSEFSPGVYLVRMKSSDKTGIAKLIVK